MIYDRPSSASVYYYSLQWLMRRPVTVFLLATISCLLVISIHQYYSYYSTINHIAGLTRRNTSSYDYYHHFPRGHLNRKSHEQAKQYSSDNNNHLNLESTIDDLTSRIEDLRRIKVSISNELRTIEREKAKILKEKFNLISKNDKLLAQISKSKAQLRQLDLDISSNRKRKFEQSCDTSRLAPIIFNPLKSIDLKQTSIYNESQYYYDLDKYKEGYQIEANYPHQKSFNHSSCPLTEKFKFYVPNPKHDSTNNYQFQIDPNVVQDTLQNHRQYTANVDKACLVVSIAHYSSENVENSKNHVIIDLTIGGGPRLYANNRTAAFASSSFPIDQMFRDKYDLVIPSLWNIASDYDSIVGSIPPQSPIERKYLASYFGRGDTKTTEDSTLTDVPPEILSKLNPLEKVLQVIHQNSIDDLFLFRYNCNAEANNQCNEERERAIELSTFLIILPGEGVSDDYSNHLLYLALSKGAVPVFIGREQIKLPFDEVIDWRRATLMLHTARLPEVHFIMRSIEASDLYQLKYHGRRIFENYIATSKQILDTTISLISLERFGYPPLPVEGVVTKIYNSDSSLNLDTNCTSTACLDTKSDVLAEILGPRDKAFASPSYRRNFSLVLNSAYDLWNDPIQSPMQLYPSYPNDPVPPSEYKFLTPDQGFRPIGDGLGGSGTEFSRALGGDYRNEQFTIILLTYERQALLMKTLERLKGLPYLNKILVIWNGVKHEPTPDLIWPDVGVPIKVVQVERNSLNNRFVPYDEIETDAVLSLDDDSPLRPDEIVFAFRVWRQSRDRIVGFPGRYHAWDSSQNSWMYNSNHSCELSMVLTGGAFFHRYYSYIYSYDMPEAIRSIVDKFMNCEDIAMNFLVAHLTRKPPIKVTSRWTFHCPNCPSSLSEDDSHFRERHECLNTFASIYGYMPLLSTQYRSDSVLFKTRLPHDKQKCFKYV